MTVRYGRPDGGASPHRLATGNCDRSNDGAVIEVEDIEPGTTKRFSVQLKRGKYVLLCNVAGHYKLGQYSAFRVN